MRLTGLVVGAVLPLGLAATVAPASYAASGATLLRAAASPAPAGTVNESSPAEEAGGQAGATGQVDTAGGTRSTQAQKKASQKKAAKKKAAKKKAVRKAKQQAKQKAKKVAKATKAPAKKAAKKPATKQGKAGQGGATSSLTSATSDTLVITKDGRSAVTRGAAAKTATPATPYRLPFVCDTSWTGSTRSYHSPSAHSVDFNAPDDLGKPVLASAAGRVVTSNNSGTTGYGRYVVLDHGNGETSIYAHLQHAHVTVGTWVDQGALIGQLGTTGNSSGPHLHYEQKVGKTVVAPWFNGAKYAYGTSRSANCVDVPVAGKLFEGEGTQVAVFRRTATSQLHVRTPQGTSRMLTVGTPTDEPLLGDWTGEGVQSFGGFDPISRTFTLSGESGFFAVQFGDRGDRPVAGDWDGDGVTEVGVYRPSTTTFRLRSVTGTVSTVKLGKAGDIPVTGDWDGDGLTDVGVFDPATATFTLRTRAAKPVTTTVKHGAAGDLPVAADWNDDGVTDVGTWTPKNATFSLRTTPTGGAAAQVTSVRHGKAR